MSGQIYIFAGGGTGGHLFPALAVAEELIKLQPDGRIVFACSDRDIDRRILSLTPYAMAPQPVRPLPGRLRGWAGFLRAYVDARRMARNLVRDLRPAAVLGLGAFAAAPVTAAASGAGIRTALMSIDAIPGRANRHLAPKVDAIFTQFEQTAGAFGSNAAKVEMIGCPVRSSLLDGDADEARKAFGLRANRRTLLVMAGSLGAESINRAFDAIRSDLDELADDWQVLHITGPGRIGKAARAGGGGIHCSVMEFCERMDLAYSAADMALCRAGASTVGELAATAAPAVLMPYPYHRDRHQAHNAAAMVSSGSAIVVDDAADPSVNADALRASLLDIMRRPERLEAMRAAAAGRTGQTNAARRIAQWLVGA